DDADNITGINCVYSECIYSENATFTNAGIENASIQNNFTNKLYSTIHKIEDIGAHSIGGIFNYFDVDSLDSVITDFDDSGLSESSLILIENLSGGKVIISNS